MNIQPAIELIEKNRHIALALPPNASIDHLTSAEALCHILQKKEKRVGLFAPNEIPLNPLLLRERGGEFLGKANFFPMLASRPSLPHEFIISVNASESPLAELRYEKSGDALDIILSPGAAPITDKNVSFRKGKILCDCAILVGVPDPEILNGSLGIEPDFFDKTPLINIDISSANKLYGEVNLVDSNKISLGEIAYELATALSAEPLDKDSATLLLAAIFEKTDGLQTLLSADTLMTASELMRLGAKRDEALTFAKKTEPVELLQLLGRASVRSKLDSARGVLWSFLTAEDFEKTGRTKNDVSRVLQCLEESFPSHQIRVLLWQPGGNESGVRATLAGSRPLLEKLQGLTPSEFQSPHLELADSFDSFRTGEVHITALLKEVL